MYAYTISLLYVIQEDIQKNTVNEERYTGLNFHVFHSSQEYHGSFSVNICLYYIIQASYNDIV